MCTTVENVNISLVLELKEQKGDLTFPNISNFLIKIRV